jgi:hypothetical protein
MPFGGDDEPYKHIIFVCYFSVRARLSFQCQQVLPPQFLGFRCLLGFDML